MADDFPAGREPVAVVGAGAARPNARQPGAKTTAAEKLLRRLVALPAGRYELILTIDENGMPADWSVRYFGKVEGPS